MLRAEEGCTVTAALVYQDGLDHNRGNVEMPCRFFHILIAGICRIQVVNQICVGTQKFLSEGSLEFLTLGFRTQGSRQQSITLWSRKVVSNES